MSRAFGSVKQVVQKSQIRDMIQFEDRERDEVILFLVISCRNVEREKERGR